jgi:hypothetical protein
VRNEAFAASSADVTIIKGYHANLLIRIAAATTPELVDVYAFRKALRVIRWFLTRRSGN